MTGQQWFVTSTGTDIGKTFITSLIARYLRRQGCDVALAKPMMSGVTNLHENDAATLLHALSHPITDAHIRAMSPWIFAEALSPHRAAERAGTPIAYESLLAWCRGWLAEHPTQHCLMEGAGGVAVPLTYQHTTLTWLNDLQLPLLLVVGDYLGTISHGLTALQCLHQAGLKVEAIIVNQSQESTDHAGVCATLRAFSPYTDSSVLSCMRYSPEAISVWNDDTMWQQSLIWQQQQDFFMTLKKIMID